MKIVYSPVDARLTVYPIRAPAPEEPARDIYAEDRAKIAERDWARVHVRGDRSAPIFLPDRNRCRVLGKLHLSRKD